MDTGNEILMAIGKIHLNVSHLERATLFFEEALGMKTIQTDALFVTLGTQSDQPLLVLHRVNNPPPRKKTTGLFHVAIRLPEREELARLIYHLVNNQVDLEGIADHGVSEAVYLTGPDEIGIELTCDRAIEDWPFDEEGHLDMGTDELDLDNLMLTLQGKAKPWQGMPASTTIGHIHLRVAELNKTADFYEKLGFELTQEYGEEALFFASGEYHHQIGANIWQSADAAPLPPDTAGLRHFEIVFPDQAALTQKINQLQGLGLNPEATPEGALLRDPNGIAILLLPPS
ncbi:MAG: glyoxalase [Chloroflexi bacterium HGW-Chloroflexi-10]|nr:MAG: glyoxalase [Chloroflexi bacterium HGW-Chloroflexi-10]